MTDYAVKAKTTTGWKVIKWFDNPADADKWLIDYVKANNYSIEDFTIKAIKA